MREEQSKRSTNQRSDDGSKCWIREPSPRVFQKSWLLLVQFLAPPPPGTYNDNIQPLLCWTPIGWFHETVRFKLVVQVWTISRKKAIYTSTRRMYVHVCRLERIQLIAAAAAAAIIFLSAAFFGVSTSFADFSWSETSFFLKRCAEQP